MPERKVWSEEEDKILRLLREQRGERKWANIARAMQSEFGICGRTGKQCRERYHNHLDSSIINCEWTLEEEQVLFRMHEEIGNKWSVISQKLPGRTDNCVKNHFYSKLRKAVRRLNKLIAESYAAHHRSIKESLLSRIVKTTESKFKNNSKIDEELADFCNSIKNRLFRLQLIEGEGIEDVDFARKIILDVQTFDRDYKKGYKSEKSEMEHQYKTYLKPPTSLKKNSSSHSFSSDKSEDSSSSFLSSCSWYSSSDLSQFDGEQQPHRLAKPGEKSLGRTSGRNSEDIPRSELTLNHPLELEEKKELQYEHILKPSAFQIQYEDLIMDDSQLYGRNHHMLDLGFDETPQIGSILAPREIYASFYLFQNDNEEIEYKADSDRMDIQ